MPHSSGRTSDTTMYQTQSFNGQTEKRRSLDFPITEFGDRNDENMLLTMMQNSRSPELSCAERPPDNNEDCTSNISETSGNRPQASQLTSFPRTLPETQRLPARVLKHREIALQQEATDANHQPTNQVPGWEDSSSDGDSKHRTKFSLITTILRVIIAIFRVICIASFLSLLIGILIVLERRTSTGYFPFQDLS